MNSHVDGGEAQVSSSMPHGHIDASFLPKANVPQMCYRMQTQATPKEPTSSFGLASIKTHPCMLGLNSCSMMPSHGVTSRQICGSQTIMLDLLAYSGFSAINLALSLLRHSQDRRHGMFSLLITLHSHGNLGKTNQAAFRGPNSIQAQQPAAQKS